MSHYLRRAAGLIEAPAVRPSTIPVYGPPTGLRARGAPVHFGAAAERPPAVAPSAAEPTATTVVERETRQLTETSTEIQLRPEIVTVTETVGQEPVRARPDANALRAIDGTPTGTETSAVYRPPAADEVPDARAVRPLEVTARPVVVELSGRPVPGEQMPAVPASTRWVRRSQARAVSSVQVTIGRVEIRATTAQSAGAAGRTPSRPRKPAVSLDDYLSGRKA